MRHQIQLRGWKAAAAILVVLTVTGLRWSSANESFSEEGHEVLLTWVRSDVLRELQENPGLTDAERTDAYQAAYDVEFAEVKARGAPDDLVVRIMLKPSAAVLPGMEGPRYFRMEYSSVLGWMTPDYTKPLVYYLKLL